MNRGKLGSFAGKFILQLQCLKRIFAKINQNITILKLLPVAFTQVWDQHRAARWCHTELQHRDQAGLVQTAMRKSPVSGVNNRFAARAARSHMDMFLKSTPNLCYNQRKSSSTLCSLKIDPGAGCSSCCNFNLQGTFFTQA